MTNLIDKKTINNFFSYLVIFLPIALITGPFLTNLIVSLTSIYMLILLFFSNDIKKYLLNKINLILLFFWFYIVLRSVFASNPYLSLESSLFYGRFIFFSIGIAYIIEKNPNFVKFFGYSLWLCLFLATLDGFIQYFTGFNSLGWEQIDPERVSGFFREELILGSYLSRLLPLAFFFIYFINDKNRKGLFLLIGLIMLVLIDVLIFITGERIAFFYLTMSTVMIIILVPNFRIMRILTFIISAIIIFFIATNNNVVKNRMIDFTIEQIGLDEKNESGLRAFSNNHQQHYVSALKMFKDEPFFGKGPKMFRELCAHPDYYTVLACSSHPHHNYVQLLAETGLVGFVPILFILILTSFLLLKQFYSTYISRSQFLNGKNTILLITIFITLWPFVPSGNVFNGWLNSIYYLPFGFLLFYYNESLKKD